MTERPQAFSHALHSGYHHPTLRAWQCDAHVSATNLIYPVFVSEDKDCKEEISSLPGQYRLGVNVLCDHLEPLVRKGLKSVLLFPVVTSTPKDARGSFADSADNPVVLAIRALRARLPALLIACDVCLCTFTSHGHCGEPQGISVKLSCARTVRKNGCSHRYSAR
eukprot:m.204671 g.204671  ORF g.204671 m.204671 type:complete len:165 (-) comp22005_c1_seq5:739-1233(-)